MRSLKFYLFLGLVVLISSSFSCKGFLNPFGPNGGDIKYKSNVEIIYERVDPFESNEYFDNEIMLNVLPAGDSLDDWTPIQKTMEKITDRKFKYVAEKIPTNILLWTYVYDRGRSAAGGPEFTGIRIFVDGVEATDIRYDPWGNGWKVAYFKITS